MKKVTLVTVNFNSEDETHNLLASLKHIHYENFSLSIVVVDNGSKIPFELSIEEKKENILLITTKENLGFAGGYNVGMRYGLDNGAEYVVVLNNDTIVEKNCIEEMLRACESEKKCGIVVPKIYFAKNHEFHKDRYSDAEKGKVFWFAGGYMDWANIFSRHRGVDEVDTGQYDNTEKVDFATGCCMCIPRDVLEKVGLFDEKLFLYFEDADLSQRVLKAGYTIIYAPKAVIWHTNAASGGGSGSILHDYYITRNRMIFGMKYAPLRSKIALLRESLRLLVFGRKWQKAGIKDFYLGKFGKGSFGN
ncbi:MAG TPA: glycosyltransferase family 2 protein [Candidatus Eisenbacteria bacterium]|nr:glycosyltransferase family 2 protein [Candidatus Eisenbacteria bacterium]